MYRQDWLMRQIEMLVVAIARILFHKDSIDYRIEDEENMSQTDLLYNRLMKMIDKRELCEAENLLFELLDPNNKEHITLVVDFYQTINRLTDDELYSNNFPREEIDSGLRDALKIFGISIPE